MDLQYASRNLERMCTQEKRMKRELNEAIAKALRRRIAQLRAAERWDDLLQGTGRWEVLVGDRAGQWSTRLSGNWRLIVEPVAGEPATARVVEIVDYHVR